MMSIIRDILFLSLIVLVSAGIVWLLGFVLKLIFGDDKKEDIKGEDEEK